MKAGLVMNCFVLAAFAKFGGSPAPLLGLFTGDEEIGSPEGRAVIEAEARRARVVFNSEPGRLSGNVVTGRKGGVFMQMRVTGKAAHSGGSFTEGISAIEELARKIQAIHALTDLDRGITLNVGLIRGGQSVNTVAPWAEGEIDLRYIRPEDRDDTVATISRIVETSAIPGTRSELSIRGEFLPLTQTASAKRLFELYVSAAADSGFKTAGEFTGGCADSGFTGAVGTPTICAVGPVGGKAHSPEEFLRLDSLVPRAQACARAILRLNSAGL
jgi:glutamate carboxypeptidase